MRLAGTINYKTGAYARVIEADLALTAVRDRRARRRPARPLARRRRPPRTRRAVGHDDPYKRIAPPEYFQRLAGISVPRGGLVSLPRPRPRRPPPVVQRRRRRRSRAGAATRGLRRARRDLRPRLGAGRRPVGPRAARRRRSRAPARACATAFGERHERAAARRRRAASRASPPALYVVRVARPRSTRGSPATTAAPTPARRSRATTRSR